MKGQARRHMALCLCLLSLLLAFIWGNSLLDSETSASISGWVADFLGKLFPGEHSTHQGHGLLRKAAHFLEFMALGILLSRVFSLLGKEKEIKSSVLAVLLCGCLVACVDEGIQCFVPGRGPGVLDVLLDLAGAGTGILLSLLGRKIKNKKQQNHQQ